MTSVADRGAPNPSLATAISVETDLGWILLPPDEVMLPWIRQYGCWEPEVAGCLRSLLAAGMTFVDVGAHVGYHTLLASQAVGRSGRVVAVEPEPANFALLLANLEAHRASNVQAIRAAAWRESGQVFFQPSSANSGDHRVSRTQGPRATRVPAMALDEVLAFEPTVDLIKSDVQGTDHVAIKGMEATIARCRPIIVSEFWPAGIAAYGDDPLVVLDYYRELGLTLHLLEARSVPADAPAGDFVRAAEAAAGGFATLILRGDRRDRKVA